MKNFEIYKGLIYSETLEKLLLACGCTPADYDKKKNEWISFKNVMCLKYPKLKQQVKKITNKMVDDVDSMIIKTVRQNNTDRRLGVSFRERQKHSVKINWLKEKRKEFASLDLRPLEEWQTPEDWRNIKEYGWDWFIRLFYKRVCKN